MNNYYLTFDIGGLSLKYMLMDSKNNIIIKNKIEHNLPSRDKIYENILKIYHKISSNYNIKALGIASSGLVNSNENAYIIEEENKIKKIKDYLNINIPIVLENDARAALISECEFGNATESNNTLLYTIGTALGGAISINNKIYYGSNYRANEIGCGKFFNKKGNISMNTGMNSLQVKFFKKTKLNYSAKDIYSLAENDVNIIAKKLVDEQIKNISLILFNSSFLLDPETILIGGAVSENEWFMNQLEIKINKLYYKSGMKRFFVLKPAKNKNDAGMLGVYLKMVNKYEEN